MSCIINWLTGTQAANFGSFISGVSTLAALIFAGYQVTTWRKNQKDLKRSEAASEAILGCEKLKLAIKDLTSIFLKLYANVDPGTNLNASDAFQERVNWAYKTNDSNLQIFNHGYIQAKIYLNEEINQLFNEVNADLNRVKGDLNYISYCMANIDERGDLPKTIEAIFGKNQMKERDSKINGLIATLGAIARLEE